jgi:hypothetical protein
MTIAEEIDKNTKAMIELNKILTNKINELKARNRQLEIQIKNLKKANHELRN